MKYRDLTYDKAVTWCAVKGLEPPIRFEMREDNLTTGLRLYFENGIEPGGMMRRLLEGNIWTAYDSMHMTIKEDIGMIGFMVASIRENLPRYCYGSPEIVQKWIEQGGIGDREWYDPWTMYDYGEKYDE